MSTPSKPPKPEGQKPASLTPRQQAFVAEYLVDLNATQAALRAGYSAKTAASQGQRLLKNVEIQKAVSAAKRSRKQRVEVTADRVVQELMHVAFSDIRNVIKVNDDGTVQVRDLDTLEPSVTRAIGEITQTSTERFDPERGSTVEKVRLGIKHHSKVAALRMLMDHLGMDAEKRLKIESETTNSVRKLLMLCKEQMSPAAFQELLQVAAQAGEREGSAA